jgi:hypothetical protein
MERHHRDRFGRRHFTSRVGGHVQVDSFRMDWDFHVEDRERAELQSPQFKKKKKKPAE